MIDPYGLIESSRKLLAGNASDEDIRRAISTAYYALFHALTNSNAEVIAGTPQSAAAEHAWSRTYRGLEHGRARNNLQANRNLISQDGNDFTNTFINAQEERAKADYDPDTSVTLTDALNLINQAEMAIRQFHQMPADERRFLAAQSLLDNR